MSSPHSEENDDYMNAPQDDHQSDQQIDYPSNEGSCGESDSEHSNSFSFSDDNDDNNDNQILIYTSNQKKNKQTKNMTEYDPITCSHEKYKQKCKIIAQCCEEVFPCWMCHNDYFGSTTIKDSMHFINTQNIEKIICKECGKTQNISNKCILCKTQFAVYYCNICKIHINSKNNFHCELCKSCVEGNKKDYCHCNTCVCCVKKDIYKTHKCMPNRLSNDCPICLDKLATTVEEVVILSCGHTLHMSCYTTLIKYMHKCPICSKTIKDTTKDDKRKDEQIKIDGYGDQKIIFVGCYDCETKCLTIYHYVGTKCSNCKSYNTYPI